MATPKTTIRFTEKDLTTIRELQENRGFSSLAETLRYAVKVAHGLDQTILDLQQEAIARMAAAKVISRTEEA